MQLLSRAQGKISAIFTAAVIAANAGRAEPATPVEKPEPLKDGIALLDETNLPPHGVLHAGWLKKTHEQTSLDFEAAARLYSALPAQQRQGELSGTNFSNRLAGIRKLWNKGAETTEAMREHCAAMPAGHQHHCAAPLSLDVPFSLAAQSARQLKDELSIFSQDTAVISNRVAQAKGVLNPQREAIAAGTLQGIEQAKADGDMSKVVRAKAALEGMLERASIAKITLWVSGTLAGITSLFVAARPLRKLWKYDGYGEFGKEYMAGKKRNSLQIHGNHGSHGFLEEI